ncbi:MAG: hypothetical protein PWP59_1765, partial [Sphaerochaeta sp.]|nr:hypothetical protein [Sphaerochaeta sp.]
PQNEVFPNFSVLLLCLYRNQLSLDFTHLMRNSYAGDHRTGR